MSQTALLLLAGLLSSVAARQTPEVLTIDRAASQVTIHVGKAGLFRFAGHTHEVIAQDVNAPSTQGDRTDDWETLGTLRNGARVLVTTDQEPDIRGKLKTASADVLVLVDEQGLDRTLRRDETREVRVGPRYGGGQYAGFGLLLGGALGLVVGSANQGDSNLAGLGPWPARSMEAFLEVPWGTPSEAA